MYSIEFFIHMLYNKINSGGIVQLSERSAKLLHIFTKEGFVC